jgi:hypothetical protein
LYTGTGSAQTIANGIDLSGEGGLVWTKRRAGGNSNYSDHWWVDSERGDSYGLRSNLANAQFGDSSLGFSSSGYTAPNSIHFTQNATDYASWTFRKAPKFFDVVTWTGNSTSGREIAHNLGSVPGVIIVKSLTEARQWMVYHRSTGNANALILNSTAASASTALWNSTDPTSTAFTLNNDGDVNTTGNTYVAYLWAHNDGDGEFGPDGNADIIKCGVATISGDTTVDLGWEPQWVLYKNASANGNWTIIDSMRGFTADGAISALYPNTSGAESAGSGYEKLTSTGFVLQNYTNGHNYVYVAIRRGTAVPTSATEVFNVEFGSASPKPWFKSGFPVDFGFFKNKDATGNWQSGSRLTQGTSLNPNKTQAEEIAASAKFDYQNGWYNNFGASTSWLSWMWKRAPNYMDVVAYQGTGTAGFTFNHNLGVVPEMIWVKNRGASEYWAVYHKDLNGGTNPSHYYLKLNDTNAEFDYNEIWNDTEPTATQVTVGQQGVVNSASFSHIAYLFATLAGISKVGSVTHSGTTNVDCGFSSGARFVLLKRTDATGDWYVWDSERGIVSGNDPYLLLNTTAAEVTSTDYIDPLSSGFTITSSFTAGDYIFYAIA